MSTLTEGMNNTLNRNIILHVPFDGGSLNDISGNNNHLAVLTQHNQNFSPIWVNDIDGVHRVQ